MPSDLKTNSNIMSFCTNATCSGIMEEVMRFCAPLSECNCSITDYHFTPRGYSTPAFSMAMDGKTAPLKNAAHQAHMLVNVRKAVMS